MNKKLEYTGFWLRFVASTVDGLLLLLVLSPFMIYHYYNSNFDIMSLVLMEGDFLINIHFDIYVNYILPFLLTLIFWGFFQATPGKITFRAKILDAKTGGKPNILQYIIRYLAYIPSVLFLGLGFLWIAFDKRKQGWHDKIAGTVVVRDPNKTEVKFNQ
mgnify:CR=1 FL=1